MYRLGHVCAITYFYVHGTSINMYIHGTSMYRFQVYIPVQPEVQTCLSQVVHGTCLYQVPLVQQGTKI